MTPQLKLTLKEQNGVQVLTVMSPITADDFKIIRAGLVKLLKDGKNKIDVHFDSSEPLDLAVVNELKALNTPARDLAGEIVVSSPNEVCRKSIALQVQPKELSVFETIEQATSHLTKKPSPTEDSQLIQKLQAQVAGQEQGEMGKLKTENEQLRSENERLLESLDKMLIERATGFDAQAFVEKISVLEKKIETLVAEQDAKKPAAGAGG